MALARKTHPSDPLADLYETDYSRWLFENARLLREGRWSEIDAANIAEELEDMGRSEKRAVASHMAVLLLHLLKWHFQPPHRSSGWRGSIHNARRAIEKLLRESPSLRKQVPDLLVEEYPDARYNAIIETGMPESSFPADCPYTVEQILDDSYWPESS
jgi:hypothetical protein